MQKEWMMNQLCNWVREMARWVTALPQSPAAWVLHPELSEVKGERWHSSVVLWLPRVHHGTCAHMYHTVSHGNNEQRKNLNKKISMTSSILKGPAIISLTYNNLNFKMTQLFRTLYFFFFGKTLACWSLCQLFCQQNNSWSFDWTPEVVTFIAFVYLLGIFLLSFLSYLFTKRLYLEDLRLGQAICSGQIIE